MDASVVAITGDGDEVDRRRPLLAPTNEIHPYSEPPLPPQPPGTDAKPEQQKPQRVASLDVFRGLTVAVSRILASSHRFCLRLFELSCQS
jgi:heparan-alpha-glucosaminide N-acetyltransferase